MYSERDSTKEKYPPVFIFLTTVSLKREPAEIIYIPVSFPLLYIRLIPPPYFL